MRPETRNHDGTGLPVGFRRRMTNWAGNPEEAWVSVTCPGNSSAYWLHAVRIAKISGRFSRRTAGTVWIARQYRHEEGDPQRPRIYSAAWGEQSPPSAKAWMSFRTSLIQP